MDAVKPSVAILGAGLLGRMIAVALMKHYQVTLFDKDQGDAKQSAGYLAAAMLAPLAESADSSIEVMQLGEKALAMWSEFLTQLDMPVYFQQTGSLIVAFEQDKAVFQQFVSRLKSQQFERVNAERIQALEPEISSRFTSGLYLPQEGQLDNRQLLKALANQIKKQDVTWHKNVHIEVDSEQVWVNNRPLSGYHWVIDCRGFGLKKDLNQDPLVQDVLQKDILSFRGVRGEVVRVKAPDVKLNRPLRLMHPRYPLYIAPKENHHFVIGATQLESEDSRRPTVRSALELLSACFSVHRGFAEAEILSIDAGIRPAFLDNHPKVFVHQNRITLNGLYRHGYLLAPILVNECKRLILKDKKNSKTELPGLVTYINPYKKPTKNSIKRSSLNQNNSHDNACNQALISSSFDNKLDVNSSFERVI